MLLGFEPNEMAEFEFTGKVYGFSPVSTLLQCRI